MSDYEIGVYNKVVREKIRSGEDWNNDLGISAEYENVLYYDIKNAASIEEVERRVAVQFPPAMGFVLDFVRLVPMELTASHAMQGVLLLATVAGGYAVVKSNLSRVMQDLELFHKNHDKYKSNFDERLDAAESDRSVLTARVNTLADLNSRLARLEMGQEMLFKEADMMKKLHNGKHPKQE